MKTIFYLILLFLTTQVNAYTTDISSAYAIAIFDEKGNGENIQHKKRTNFNYNGLCYSKIVVIGKLNGTIPRVTIGDSRGQYLKSISIYNKKNIKIGEEITYKHSFLQSGYFKVKIKQKIYDTKVFIK